jgi:hypothetical protein
VDILQTFIATVLGSAGGIAITGYLARSLLSQHFARELERLRSGLQAQNEVTLERMKTDLSLLSRKRDILLDEKIRVFKDLQYRLVSLKRYLAASAAEYGYASEFAPRPDSLPAEIERSTLNHLTALHNLIEENFIFLSQDARQLLDDFTGRLSLVCSMELHIGNPDIADSAASVYDSWAQEVDRCLEALYLDLQFPSLDLPAKLHPTPSA